MDNNKYLIMVDKQGNVLRCSSDTGKALENLYKVWEAECPPGGRVLLLDNLPPDFDHGLYAWRNEKLVKVRDPEPSLEERIERIERALAKAGLLKL